MSISFFTKFSQCKFTFAIHRIRISNRYECLYLQYFLFFTNFKLGIIRSFLIRMPSKLRLYHYFVLFPLLNENSKSRLSILLSALLL